MNTTTQDIDRWIKAGLPNCDIEVEGDGRHFTAKIISNSFQGLSLVQRHQMVYKILGEKMDSEIHALSMQTLTPQESTT